MIPTKTIEELIFKHSTLEKELSSGKIEKKLAVWNKLANEFKIDSLTDITNEISLNNLPEAYQTLIDGKAVGRYLVKI